MRIWGLATAKRIQLAALADQTAEGPSGSPRGSEQLFTQLYTDAGIRGTNNGISEWYFDLCPTSEYASNYGKRAKL